MELGIEQPCRLLLYVRSSAKAIVRDLACRTAGNLGTARVGRPCQIMRGGARAASSRACNATAISSVPHLNARGHQYVGRALVVAEAIDCGRGKVRAADTLWCAEGADAPVGTSVKVTGARGTVLLAERATP
jgi:hypothetical protein